jgi:hypothetical protein
MSVQAPVGARSRFVLSWRLGLLVLLVVVAIGAGGVEDSATVHLRWRVLPYQTLRLSGSQNEVSQLVYQIPVPTSLDRSRGYVDDTDVGTLKVVSNTPWKLEVEFAGAQVLPVGVRRFELRCSGGSFVPVGGSPQVLASGTNGVYQVTLDYRVVLDPEVDIETSQPLVLVYTLMSN